MVSTGLPALSIILGAQLVLVALAYLVLGRERRRREAAAQAIADHDPRARATFEQAAVGIGHVAPDRTILRVNRKLERLLGRSATELAGHNFADFSHPEDREAATAARTSLYRREADSAIVEKRYLRPDGGVVWLRVTLSVARDALGEPKFEIAVFEDISAARRAHAELRRFRAALDLSSDAVYIIARRSMRIVDVNEGACRMLGYSRDELVGADVASLFANPALTSERLAALYDKAIGAGIVRVQSKHRRKDGKTLPVEIHRTGLAIDGEQYVVGVVRDVSARRAAEQALRDSEERYRRVVQLSPDAMFIIQDGRVAFINDAGVRLFGAADAAQMIGRNVLEHVHPASRAMVEQRLRAFADGATFQPRAEQVYLRLDGTPAEVEVMSARFSHAGAPAVLSVARDVSERKRAERLLALEHAVTRGLAEAESAAAGVRAVIRALCEAEGWEAGRYFAADEAAGLLRFRDSWVRAGAAYQPFEAASSALSFARGTGVAGLVWSSAEPIWIPDVTRDPRVVNQALGAQSDIRALFVFPVTAEGRTIGVLATYSREVRAPDERLLRAVRVVGSQLGQFLSRKEAEQRLAHLAQFDPLTGLANRVLFRDRLDQSIAQAARNRWQVGLLFADLDRFKSVNDSLGHAVGDELLRQVAARLQVALRAGDTVARLGGDEFAVILPDLESADAAGVVAEKMLAALKAPFAVAGQEVYVTASIGATVYPLDSADADALLRNADVAMYRAKEAGRNGYQYFTPAMNAEAALHLALEKDLRRAIERGELELHYQPKADVTLQRVTGVEALLRWRRADGELVPPGQFVPVLESTGLIAEVGEWVIAEACRQVVAWNGSLPQPLAVAVNVSARQFRDGRIVESVKRALAETGCAPHRLELEITESLLMHDVDVSVGALEELRALGVRVSVDDFGTGYSSLSYLSELPLDALKIDRSFIKDLSEDANGAAITTAIIGMARSLGYRTIAEGVETALQRQFLEACGCDEVQGYLLSRPLPPDELRRWLQARASPSSA